MKYNPLFKAEWRDKTTPADQFYVRSVHFVLHHLLQYEESK
jgi:hypothetical protein